MFLYIDTVGLFYELYYGNYKFTGLNGLKSNPKFPTTPDSYGFVNGIETSLNINSNYGQRIRGWFQPKESKNYAFSISCSVQCELYLSTDSSPGNKTKILSSSILG